MIHFNCDLCGKPLLADEDVRYVVRITVTAAYDPMEITGADLARDHTDEMRRLIDRMAEEDAETLEGQVYRAFRFDLCAGCKEQYEKAPLGGGSAPEKP